MGKISYILMRGQDKGEEALDEDLKLIKEVLKGNVDSFSILMNKYEHMVFSFAYNMINDREAAQDVTQEVFIIVYNKLYMYDKKYKFKNWLLKIARNKCIDYIRKYKRVYEANIEDITYIYDKNPGPEEAMEIREAKLIIRDFIGKLGDIDRQIITLKYSSGTTFVDIGEVMGMTEGAVKRRYYKIRDSFKKHYEREQREKEVQFVKCKTFRDHMYEYMEGDLSRDMEKSMDMHKEQCMKCREVFEEEKAMDDTFKRAFDNTYIEFDSTRNSVLESIDRNKYSNKNGNKLYYKFCKSFKSYGAIVAMIIGMLILAPFIKNLFSTSSEIVPLKHDESMSKITFDITSEEISISDELKGLSWNNSKDSRYTMAIYNDEDQTDMKPFIFFTDNNIKKSYKLTFKSKNNSDIKIYEFKWMEDNNIMILLSDKDSKLQGGNKLIVLNLENLSFDIIYGTETSNDVFREFTINHNQIRIDTTSVDETGRQIGKGVEYVDFKDVTTDENNEVRIYLNKIIEAIKNDDYESISGILEGSKINKKYMDSDIYLNKIYKIGNEEEGKREFLIDFLCVKDDGNRKRYIKRVMLENKYEKTFLKGLGVE